MVRRADSPSGAHKTSKSNMLSGLLEAVTGKQAADQDLRDALTAVVGRRDDAALSDLLDRHETLCGPAGRRLVTKPLFSTLNSWSAQAAQQAAAVPEQWELGCRALQLLRDLTRAGFTPPCCDDAEEVSTRSLLQTAKATIYALARNPLLVADPATLTEERIRMHRVLTTAFNAAWGIVGALAVDDAGLAAELLTEALRDPHMRFVCADQSLLGPFFEAGVMTAGTLVSSKPPREAEAQELLAHLFRLDARASPRVTDSIAQCHVRRTNIELGSPIGASLMVASLYDWVAFRENVASHCPPLFDWKPYFNHNESWLWRTARTLRDRINAKAYHERLRTVACKSLLQIWNNGELVTATFAAVLSELARLPHGTLTPFQDDVVSELGSLWFVEECRRSAPGCFEHLPDHMRDRALDLATIMTAGHAAPFGDMGEPAWFKRSSRPYTQIFRQRCEDAFFGLTMGQDMLLPDGDSICEKLGNMSEGFLPYVQHFQDLLTYYPTYCTRLVITIKVHESSPSFAARLARHTEHFSAFAAKLTLRSDPESRRKLGAAFALGAEHFRSAVQVVGYADSNLLTPPQAASMLQALQVAWRFYAISSPPEAARQGAPVEQQQQADERRALFFQLVNAIRTLLPALAPGTPAERLDRARNLLAGAKGGGLGFTWLDLRFELMVLRIMHESDVPLPESVTGGALELALELLSLPHRAAVSSAVAGRRRVAHELFVAAVRRPSSAAARALLRYLPLCIPAAADGISVVARLGALPPPLLVAFFCEQSSQLVVNLDGWTSDVSFYEQGEPDARPSAVGILLLAVRSLGAACGALTAEARRCAEHSPKRATLCRKYRDMYLAALFAFFSGQSPQVVSAAADGIERALAGMQSQDVSHWLRCLARKVHDMPGTGSKHERVLWVMQLEERLLGAAGAARAAKL
eukprot:TRINITY_DN65438_c0_g1_i1.p1 TRINITY_DN65438_c0_g1~~TRINITY_DN65438_c0_g1_i1.p1  ORF type:complete len:925 (+),score=200.96 TRINITY_DN65438_c0_g1_i1:75-2849(+)